ncbi:hypothetical protein [uncultured Desulfuromusa sp.]|uniref:tetratricopeptide repeat protein n=1 Tax=uncultured Desulfuromusa sp. TaxID=219183 RepID=UPI002AA7DD21|nr:hypothetical protein [uncultured Desulfuromusa sp.]
MKYFIFLSLILLLSSCVVNPTPDQRDSEPPPQVLIEEDVQLEKTINDHAVQQLKNLHPEAFLFHEQARAAEVKGDMNAAIELYHKAMQQAPTNGLLLTSLGLAYLRIEDIIPARRYLLKAVNADPGYYKPKLGLGYIYLQTQQTQKAVTQLEDSLKQVATLEGTFLLGKAKEAQAEFLQARHLYQAVIRVDGNGRLGQAAANRLRSLPK